MADIIVILGSTSDEEAVRSSKMFEVLDEVGVSWTAAAISAHRNPEELRDYCLSSGGKVFIGVAGMSAALPGAIAAIVKERPVIGVALASDVLDGMDALLSIVRMPPGVSVSCTGIGSAGLRNAAIQACQIIALGDKGVKSGLTVYLESNKREPVYNLEGKGGS
ncbi:AIR carboxylase family protein [Patescibacteria group bacterium]|nr:AIR carboxylase family protein [Patescibacteria group bacterium]